MVEKSIRQGICNAIHRYAKTNNKYMKDYDKSKESTYLHYSDVNDLYGRAVSQKFPLNNFNWIEETSQFNEDFIKSYNVEGDKGYFLEVDVHYPEKSNELRNNLPFLSERMKLKKFEKLVTNLQDKNEYVIHIRNFKQKLNHGLILKQIHRVIKFNQEAWLEPHIKIQI